MDKYEKLLIEWCDSLISLQIKGVGAPHDGGFFCSACTNIHGRQDNAVFPMLYMYKKTGDKKYYDCAKALMVWHKRLIMPDGSSVNDGSNLWKGITTFSVIEYIKALMYCRDVMDDEMAETIIKRVKNGTKWIAENMGGDDPKVTSNINYSAATACVFALYSKYFGDGTFVPEARRKLSYCLDHFTENGVLIGEGTPHDAKTERGCRPVDIGYNVEESIPCLIDAAEALGDKEALDKLAEYTDKTLIFMLSDGAWDNSFGTRNNKWTYYGSRTSDGCLSALVTLGKKYGNKFFEAARRNADLQIKCTHDGLLYGGMQYYELGQPACTHHTFCHAAGLADALINGLSENMPSAELPCDKETAELSLMPETDTYRIKIGKLTADITGYDYVPYTYQNGAAHASGGTLTLIYTKDKGPVIAGSTYIYKQTEPTNFQYPMGDIPHRTLLPRFEMPYGRSAAATCLDLNCRLNAEMTGRTAKVFAESGLCALGGKRIDGCTVSAVYTFNEDSVKIEAKLSEKAVSGGTKFVLPVVKGSAEVITDNEYSKCEIFYLSGGFKADEYTVLPDADRSISVTIKL